MNNSHKISDIPLSNKCHDILKRCSTTDNSINYCQHTTHLYYVPSSCVININVHQFHKKTDACSCRKYRTAFKFTELEIICNSTYGILSVKKICLKIPSYFCLPSVAIVKKFFFVVQQLLMCLSSKLKIGTLRNKDKKKLIRE